MHEYSIVQALLNQCEENAKAHNAKRVLKVVTKIGVLSGVEPHLLEMAFETFKEGTLCSEATFEMNIQNIKLHCQKCRDDFEIDELKMVCPKCGTLETTIVDGEEMYLMSLEME
jgi:hydrogenase nickel insertion protein HypA